MIDWMMLSGTTPAPVSPPKSEPKGTTENQGEAEPVASSDAIEDISWFLLSEVPRPTSGTPTVMQTKPSAGFPAPTAVPEMELPDVDLAALDNFDLDFASTPQDFGLDLPAIPDTEALLDLPDMGLPTVEAPLETIPDLEPVATWEELEPEPVATWEEIAPVVSAGEEPEPV
ncbi:MAG: hypothetical protein ACUVSQ_08360, partial [Pseudanabaenaceae cyanobacterium]